MKVSSIYVDAQQITGYADQATNFSRISDAVESVSNKGLIDAMQGYLEIATTSNRLVTLPRDVEVPVKVNVGNNPSFGRTKLYEFSMNGPGSDYSPTDWSWEDRGTTPTLYGQPPSTPTNLYTTSSVADNGKFLYIWGRSVTNAEVSETLTLNSASSPVSVNQYVTVTRVIKDATANTVTLSTSTDNTILSVYAPDELEPEYRQIKLSQSGTTAHILFRRSVYRISSLNDYIPVQSRMGLLMMLRANEFFRKATAQDIQTGTMLEQQAVKFVEEEQKSRNAFAEVAAQTERDSVHGLNINNRDSIIVSDIYDDVSSMVGPVGQRKVFDRITEGIELLANKGQWESLEGYVDLTVDDESFVTLPRYVDIPLAVNIGNGPSKMRNRWFEFHLNGPGSSCPPCGSWEDHGDTVTITDLSEARGLIYKPDSAGDNGSTITIYGYDADDRNVTLTLTGNSTYDFDNISAQLIHRIERITRESTTGSAQLIAYDSTGEEATQLGYYYPDETEPSYRRIKIPCSTCWIRMRYRKRDAKITSLTNPIHLRSRLALLSAIASIQALRSEKPDVQLSEAMEAKALRYLTEEKAARNPNGTFSIQIDTRTWGASPEHGQY